MPVEVQQRITRLRLESLQSEAPTIEVEKQSVFVDGQAETPGPFVYVRTAEQSDADVEAAVHAALDLAPDSIQGMIQRWAEAQA